ncbi:CHC2 zinc finger domain-containing protein [Pedobacter sp. ASV1-7]|uniref:CHC2 zinc finger domain-containing protein n=1 Tax=Pedobacter sp. ASV1-7 TaxID=3145237 RepID=UPI0032E88927
MIPDAFKETLLRKIDLTDLVSEYVDLYPIGGQMQGLCPFHPDTKSTFNVSTDKQIFKCFKCGKGGNAIGFIMEIKQLNYPQAIRLLADKLGVEVLQEPE